MLALLPQTWAAPAHAEAVTVAASAETTPVRSSTDAADDTAVWIHPTDPSQSVVIGTDKLATGGLGVYDLAGNELHFYAHGSMNNVDLRYNFPLGGEKVALVGVTDRNDASIGARFYRVNPGDRSLTEVGRIATSGRPRGFAMYHSPDTGKYYAFLHDFHTNVIAQYELDGTGGSVSGTLVRSFDNGDTSEGITADDELKRLYVAEEDVALWRYGAEPGDGSARIAVDRVQAAGGNILPNIKNPTIYYGRNGTGYLIVSSQGGSNFLIYGRADNSFIGSFSIGSGSGVDSVSGQDGIDVTNFGLGPAFPNGLFTSQDHVNSDAGNGNSGNQNYKYVSWERIATAFTPDLLIDPLFDPRQIGAGGGTTTPDITPPNTSIGSAPSATTGNTGATFTFSANEPSTFECALDSGAFAACISPKSYSGLDLGQHSFQVRATDTSGNPDSTPAIHSWTIDPAASATLAFDAQADARVEQALPTTNFGATGPLKADNSPAEGSYLRFDVQGVSGSVSSARLRLYATGGSTNGPAVYGTDATWSETSITWEVGRPARTSGVIDDKASVPANSWVDYDVTSLVPGNGAVSFNVAGTSSDGVDMNSREAATNRPQLVLTTTAAPGEDTVPPTVTAVAPAAGAIDVPAGTSPRATFSEPVDPSTVDANTFHLARTDDSAPVAADVVYDTQSKAATLVPNAELAAGTSYTATVTTQVRDVAGNNLAEARTWSFSVASEPVPGSPDIRLEASATTVNAAALATVTVDKPAGTASGDVLVACLALNGGTIASGGAPAGWTSLASVTSIGNPRAFGYYRVVGLSDPASFTWRLSKAVAGSGGIARYSGVSSTAPLDAEVRAASGAATTAATLTGVTTGSPGAMLLGCMTANSSAASVTMAAPSGLAEVWSLAGKRQQFAGGLQTSAGSSGNKTWTFSSSREWAGWLTALRPAG